MSIATHKTPQSAANKNTASKSLFRSRFPLTDVRCLPFVRNCERRPNGRRRSFWSHDLPVGDRLQAEHYGQLFAAAYVTFIRHNGLSALPLAWILEDMGPKSDAVAIGFLFFLERYVWSLALERTPGDIESDTRQKIAHERRIIDQMFATQ